MIIFLLIMLTAGTHVQQGSIPARVDLIEFNHCHDDNGQPTYDQVVLYNWSPDYRRYDVVSWYLVEDLDHVPTKLPSRRWLVDVIYNGRRLTATSRLYRETWTQADPERLHKRFMPEKYRVDLWSQD